MVALVEITPWFWAGFIVFVLICIAVDMGAFRSRPRGVTFREALIWSGIWFALAMAFAGLLVGLRGREEATQFVAGYLIELSLSLDNILVIALIFTGFLIPLELQRRVLVWGILGALTMRGVMIGAGVALITRYSFLLYVFGAILVVAGARMFFAKKHAVELEKNPLLRLVRKLFRVSPALDGQNFFTRLNGRSALTPLALVLILVETSDLLFAFDSVPAVFSITQNAFIVFTSNVFAILGLRSLYFLLAGAINLFRYLKAGLALVLVFVGLKMLLDPHAGTAKWFQVKIPTAASLLVVLAILTLAIIFSLQATRRERTLAR